MATAGTGSRSFLCVDIDGGRYGIDAAHVAEVGNPGDLTAVPGAPRFVLGVTNHRGRILPVIDSGARLELEGHGERRTRLVVLEGASSSVALLVDGIVDIVRVDESGIDRAPSVLASTRDSFYEGVAHVNERIVGLLDVEELIRFEIDRALLAEGDASTLHARRAPARRSSDVGAVLKRFVVVRVGDEEVAFESTGVQEAIPMRPIEKTGKMPPYVLGLVKHRGGTVVALDLHRRLHPEGPGGAGRTLVILESRGEPYAVAVDSVVELLALAEDEIRPAPDIFHGGRDHIDGLAVRPAEDRVVVIVNRDRLVADEHLERVRDMGADAMSQPNEREEQAAQRELVVFETSGTTFALPSDRVREILDVPTVTPVPYAPAHVLGVFQLRGEVLAVVDLRARLGMGGDATGLGKLVVVGRGAEHVALKIDALREIRRVDESLIAAAPEVVHGVRGRFLDGVVNLDERAVLLLDADVLNERETSSTHGTEG